MSEQERAQLFLLIRRKLMSMVGLRTKLQRGYISQKQYEAALARAEKEIDDFLKGKLQVENCIETGRSVASSSESSHDKICDDASSISDCGDGKGRAWPVCTKRDAS